MKAFSLASGTCSLLPERKEGLLCAQCESSLLACHFPQRKEKYPKDPESV